MKLNTGQDLIDVDGNIVERDALKVVEELKRIDPNIEVVCLDPNRANINDAPFIICEICPDGQMRRIFEAWKLDKSVIDRVRAADMHRGINLLNEIDAVNSIMQQQNQRRFRDEMEDRKELVTSIAASNKSSFSYIDKKTGDKVTIYPDRPAKRERANC